MKTSIESACGVGPAALGFLLLVSCGGGGGGDGGDGGGGGGGGGGTNPVALNVVQPLYPVNGARWNEYVRGQSLGTASDTHCVSTDTACLHAGERRVVEATGKTSCTGLTASDALSAFDWYCDASSGTARFISTGLAQGKLLSDLIDFDSRAFKANSVSVFENATLWGQTPATVWWANAFEVSAAVTPILITQPYVIHLALGDPQAHYNLAADNVALVVRPGTTITNPAGGTSVVEATNHNFVWFEGRVDATANNDAGIRLTGVKFSVLRGVEAVNAFSITGVSAGGVFLGASSRNTLSAVTVRKNVQVAGVFVDSSNNNTLTEVTADSNTVTGIFLRSSDSNTLTAITAVSNQLAGVFVAGGANNTLLGVNASNNGGGNSGATGVFLAGRGNVLSAVTASSNKDYGVHLNENSAITTNNTLSAVTANNNVTYGVYLIGTSNTTFSAVSVSNNGIATPITSGAGIALAGSNATFDGVSSANNDVGILLQLGSNKFTGQLKVGANGNNCEVRFGVTGSGLGGNCENGGASDANLTTGITLANSFVGKVVSDDSANESDSNGAATSYPAGPTSFDWTRFDNPYRSWGIDGSAFPNVDHRGSWQSGAGRIWDWSLVAADDVNLDAFVLPSGDQTRTHTWFSAVAPTSDDDCEAIAPGSVAINGSCQTTYLLRAAEIPGDGIGNDNVLCESNEVCLHTPNLGSYQGHGELVDAGTFVDGALTGITLKRFAINGR